MGTNSLKVQPIAAALHTRDRPEDYRWFPEVGQSQLSHVLKELHRELVADQDAHPASTFIFLEERWRVGLLVANLKTNRQDHAQRFINDTLLLEFDSNDRETVLRLAAGLLAEEASAIQQHLLVYAEAAYKRQTTGQVGIEPLAVPPVASISGSDDLPLQFRVGLRSTEGNQHRVAGLLHQVASKPAERRPFVVVSTGFVGRDKLQQHAVHAQHFIALTRASSFPEGSVVLEPVAGGQHRVGKPLWIVGLLGLFGVLIGGSLLMRSSSNSSVPPPTLVRPPETQNEARRAASLVGIGVTPYGEIWLSVLGLVSPKQDDATQTHG
ncbi:MAG: hypothetical protein C0467_32195 [Planctomycetaceae bacterium]|nr:hypothetical protein [Planctomycetaceae bacterium]